MNPVKRITVQGIVEHEWFRQDLPEYLCPLLGEMGVAEIDSNVIADVCRLLDVPANDVMAAVR